jgi:THO complex subunit 4
MAAMLDQSLDAMIKETRKTAPKRRGNAAKKVGGKRAPAKNASRGPAPMSIGNGGVKKASAKKAKKRSAGAMAMAVDRVPRQQQQQRSNGAPGSKTQLIVGNLDWKVTDQDIKVSVARRNANGVFIV